MQPVSNCVLLCDWWDRDVYHNSTGIDHAKLTRKAENARRKFSDKSCDHKITITMINYHCEKQHDQYEHHDHHDDHITMIDKVKSS